VAEAETLAAAAELAAFARAEPDRVVGLSGGDRGPASPSGMRAKFQRSGDTRRAPDDDVEDECVDDDSTALLAVA
jgi:hypothetical protein